MGRTGPVCSHICSHMARTHGSHAPSPASLRRRIRQATILRTPYGGLLPFSRLPSGCAEQPRDRNPGRKLSPPSQNMVTWRIKRCFPPRIVFSTTC
jgi:hypothetical protein